MSIEPGAPTGASFVGGFAMLAAIILVLLERGQEIGRSTTHGNTTTFQNSRGQNTGRAERRPDGSTNFFDSMGRMRGSSRR